MAGDPGVSTRGGPGYPGLSADDYSNPRPGAPTSAHRGDIGDDLRPRTGLSEVRLRLVSLLAASALFSL